MQSMENANNEKPLQISNPYHCRRFIRLLFTLRRFPTRYVSIQHHPVVRFYHRVTRGFQNIRLSS
jgi:hypothetical protein